jgi:hypothetical protein
MSGLQTVQEICWTLSIFLRAFLLCLLIFRRNLRSLPFFAAYLFANLAKGLVVHLSYQAWGFESLGASKVAWASQAVVTCARALAVAEICHLLLGKYRGIWSMAWRVLASCAGIVLLYSSAVSGHTFRLAVLGATRASELAIAAVIVLLFVFLRHYEVTSAPSIRFIALGFCIYSCVAVLNLTVLQQFIGSYTPIWNALDVFAYLACLLVWTWALRKSIPLSLIDPALLSSSIYQQISPQINARLRALNEQLSQLWRIAA